MVGTRYKGLRHVIGKMAEGVHRTASPRGLFTVRTLCGKVYRGVIEREHSSLGCSQCERIAEAEYEEEANLI